MEMADLRPGERVLLVGIGTGADLPLLPEGVCVVGLDLSPEMLEHARARLPLPRREAALIRGDAQQVPVKEASFDVVMLNLILSVVPDGAACLQSALRTLKPDGRAIIFDKFLPDQDRLNVARRFLNYFSTIFGTDINRRLGDMIVGTGWKIEQDEPSLLGGMYRVMMLRKQCSSPHEDPIQTAV